jgi:membrane-bound ClpP family serine protease
MDWITIVLLLLGGIFLLMVEIIFIPGTTILGLIGGALMVFGVIIGYSKFGPQIGTIVLLSAIVIGGGVTVISFKSGVWKKFALKDTNKSKFNEDIKVKHLLGAHGIALSALRPYGKAEFHNSTYEVKTLGNYLASGTKIKVIDVDNDHKIFVEQIK